MDSNGGVGKGVGVEVGRWSGYWPTTRDRYRCVGVWPSHKILELEVRRCLKRMCVSKGSYARAQREVETCVSGASALPHTHWVCFWSTGLTHNKHQNWPAAYTLAFSQIKTAMVLFFPEVSYSYTPMFIIIFTLMYDNDKITCPFFKRTIFLAIYQCIWEKCRRSWEFCSSHFHRHCALTAMCSPVNDHFSCTNSSLGKHNRERCSLACYASYI